MAEEDTVDYEEEEVKEMRKGRGSQRSFLSLCHVQTAVISSIAPLDIGHENKGGSEEDRGGSFERVESARSRGVAERCK